MDNETRMRITDPDVPEGPAGKAGKLFIGLAVVGTIAYFIYCQLEKRGFKNVANVIHKAFHHIFPHVEDKDSEDILDS